MGKLVGSRLGRGAKFRSGKFRPGIAFTTCTTQFHLPQNGREYLERIKDGFKMEHKFSNLHLEHSVRKNRTAFSDIP